MYRFYCDTCKKVKRVQKMPSRIQDSIAAKPEDRIGRCDAHSRTKVVKQTIIRTNKVEAVVSSNKGKRR